MNPTWKRRVAQVRKRWWVVAAVTALAFAAAAASISIAHPTYVGKSTVMLAGQAPEQDAVMMLGYQTIFRDPATIPRLRAKTTIPDDVTFEAQTVASSPILTIEAFARDPKTAQSAARDMAVAFSDDINAVQKAGAEDDVAELQRQLDSIPRLDPNGATNPYYASLQERIDAARRDLTSQLLALQPEAGVTENVPNVLSTMARGVLGGLVLGVLAALGMAAVSTRVTTADELRAKTTVTPLVELPRSGAGEGGDKHPVRTQRLRTLVNLVDLEHLPRPTTLAVTSGKGVDGSRSVAAEYARTSAQRGDRTVLLHADNGPSHQEPDTGFNEVLAGTGQVRDVLRDTDLASLKVVTAGARLDDRYALATREKIAAVLDELANDADVIVVAAPSMADAADAQVVCASADATILVVDRGARAATVNSAAEALERHAHLVGAVLVDAAEGRSGGREVVVKSDDDDDDDDAADADDEDDVDEEVQEDQEDSATALQSGVIAFPTGTAASSVPERDHA